MIKPKVGEVLHVLHRSYLDKRGDASLTGAKHIKRSVKHVYSDSKVMDNCGEPWIIRRGDDHMLYTTIYS